MLKNISCCLVVFISLAAKIAVADNPIFKDILTADPAAMVYKDKVYLYTGHDEARDNKVFYDMKKWLVFSSSDMVNWEHHGSPLGVKDFSWAKSDAWAAHTIEKNGKFYCYVTVRHATINGFSIGVAIADN